MFTGIIEFVGVVSEITKVNSNYTIRIASPISNSLKIDQSVAHDGICLTVVQVGDNFHEVVAIDETIHRTTISQWKTNKKINLERCMLANGRFDGHIVQGHVDCTAQCEHIEDMNGSYKYWFIYPEKYHKLIIEKGSIAVNGTSLTVVDDKPGKFSVCIIPYTFEHTNFNSINKGDSVNIEFDILGKYINKFKEN